MQEKNEKSSHFVYDGVSEVTPTNLTRSYYPGKTILDDAHQHIKLANEQPNKIKLENLHCSININLKELPAKFNNTRSNEISKIESKKVENNQISRSKINIQEEVNQCID